MALNVSEEMTQRTGESVFRCRQKEASDDVDRTLGGKEIHSHVQRPQGTLGRREWIDGWMVRRVLTYSRISVKATGNSRSGIPGNRGPPKFQAGIPGNFLNSGGNYLEFIRVLSFFNFYC